LDYIEIKAQYEASYREFKENKLKELGINLLDNMDRVLPLELLMHRGIIEGNVIGCLYNNCEFYTDTKDILKENDFITEDGRLFYKIGLEIVKTGINIIDEVAVKTYLNGKQSLTDMFEEYGGISTIKDFRAINIDNFDAYLDTLQKYNALNKLHVKGFNVLDNLEKFKAMTSNEVYDWHDYMINNIFLQSSSAVKPVDLAKNNRDFIEKANKGLERGIDIDEPILNYRLAGLHRGNILLHTAHSGIGKSSSIIPMYILPLIKRGNKVVLLINEQSEDAWRSMLLPSIISNGFLGKDKEKWIQRNRMSIGGFSNEELEILNKAADWLDQFEGNLILYPLEDYSVRTLKKIVKKMMRLDEETTFILDTWKPEDESSSNAHAVFTEESKELFKFIKPKEMGGLNVRFIATAQLSGSTVAQRYLNINCLAKAKAIKEVCGQHLMLRRVWQDELDPKSKHYINPYRYNKETGLEDQLTLDPKKSYTIMFFDKNRYGKSDIQLIWQSNLDFNHWRCLRLLHSKTGFLNKYKINY
jgi:replicative DNA helicase